MDVIPVIPDDAESVADFLLGETWPFHSANFPRRDVLVGRVSNGEYWSERTRAFWIMSPRAERAGIVQLRDLGDPSPMFDLRLRARHRGCGLGTQAVRWLADYLFSEYPGIARIEGQTRYDNAAMRRVFERCGWVQEAHYRMAWPGADGVLMDAVGYAVLRTDREAGTVTPAVLGAAMPAAAAPAASRLIAMGRLVGHAALCRELLDPERLAVAGRLAISEATAEQIARECGMKMRHVVRALERLGSVSVVQAAEREGNTVYRLDREGLNTRLAELLALVHPRDSVAAGEPAANLRGIVEGERLLVLPAKHGKRLLALAWLAEKFERERDYPEAEVNTILTRHHPDYAAMRRALIDYGFMTRASGIYRRTGIKIEE